MTGAISLTPQTIVERRVPTGAAGARLSRDWRAGWRIRRRGSSSALVFVQVVFVTMVYGPIAAYLVEAFPARIRYTALSLPYHIGNGVFGGLLPVVGLSIIANTGNIYAGLYYPIVVAAATFVIGTLLLPETHKTRIWKEIE